MYQLPFIIAPRAADAYVNEGDVLPLGSLRAKVIHTPGHAPGHVMYHFAEQEVLIGGDLIIGGSIGRTDLPDSDHAELERSIRRVMQLSPTTRLLPGHGEVSTLAEELDSNPFVQSIMRT
jgi:glyoxylase-like metal-dependent hydrolase (beta-lactamase superfamily II)